MPDMAELELRQLAETDAAHEIPKEVYGPIITSPPFVFADGTFNTRDLGLLPRCPVRAGFVFRSGALSGLSPDGKTAVSDKLGIKRIFDLRSPEERKRSPDPDIIGVENTWYQSLSPDSTPNLDKFVAGVGEEGHKEMYLEVLDVYSTAWIAVLEHIRDRPQEPFMFHCTAGRDRTGVLAGLLLTLAGAPPDVVTLDYLLSRIGYEPVRAQLLAFAMAGSAATSQDQPGFANLCNLTEASWRVFVEAVESSFGGFEKFVTGKLGFSAEDVATIKTHLTSFS